MNTDTTFIIKNARLSFPSLFRSEVYEDKETGKFGCTLILSEEDNATMIKKLNAAGGKLIKDKLKGKTPDRKYRCLKRNEDYDTERAEYEDALMVRATNRRRPFIIGPDKAPLSEDDAQAPYSGCYVNAKVELWAAKTKGGPTLGANLITIQFAKDGKAFDGSYVTEDEALEDFDEMEPGFDDEDDVF